MIIENLLMGLIKLYQFTVFVNCIKFEEKEFGALGYIKLTEHIQ